MDKKAQKRIDLLNKKMKDIQQRLAAHANKWMTPPKSANSKPTSPPPKPKSKN